MRIAITNPDGLGDTVLRLPLFEALRTRGHHLLIVTRPHGVPLLERVVAPADLVIVHENPYELTRASRATFSPDLATAVQSFHADLLVWTPYQWTILEEYCATLLPGTPILRMNGYRFEQAMNVGLTIPAESRQTIVAVGEYFHESLKNELLAQAILNEPRILPAPSLTPSPDDLQRGDDCLQQLFGRRPASFWFGCMGTTGDYYGDLKDWGTPRWASLMRYLVLQKDQPVLLVGSDAERESLERVRTSAGLPERIAIATGDAGQREGLSRLVGLAALSSGYIGRDTGPMHIAGALGKPVVAVFGAGMWPRFTPLAVPSRALAMDLPCAPCRWVCRHPDSWCIKQVPLEAVTEALDAVISRKEPLRHARLLAASPDLYKAASAAPGQCP